MLALVGSGGALRRWWRGDPGAALVAALVLPGTVLFLWQATGSRVQGNWPAILYPGAALAAASCVSSRWRRWRRPALVLGVTMSLIVLTQAALAPLPLPRRSDPTLARLGGWDDLARQVEVTRLREGLGFVVAEEYGLAAQLALHLPVGTAVVGLGDRWRFFDLERRLPGGAGLFVRSTRRGDGPVSWTGSEQLQGIMTRSRNGIEAERYSLHRVTGEPTSASALLPRPRSTEQARP